MTWCAALGSRGDHQLFDGLEFRVLRDRLLEALPNEDEVVPGRLRRRCGSSRRRLGSWLAEHGRVIAQASTSSVTGARGPAMSRPCPFAAGDGAAAYVVVSDLGSSDENALANWLTDPERHKAMHDAKGPLLAVWARGWDLAGLTSDTQLAAYLTRPDQRTFDLADLTIRYLKRELRVEGAPDLDDPNQLALDFGDDDSGAKVAAEASMVRARAVIDLADALDVDIEQRNGTSLLYGVELPLLRTLARMEQTGWLWMSIIWRPWRRGLLPPSTVPRAMRTRCWASRSTSAHPSSSRLCCSTNWECRRPGVPAPAIRRCGRAAAALRQDRAPVSGTSAGASGCDPAQADRGGFAQGGGR